MPNVILLLPKKPRTRRDEPIEDEPIAIAAPEGGSLADLCDDHALPIPFSCRSANCGTCLIDVLEGESELLVAEREEQSVLDLFGATEGQRLACCVTMRPGLGTLRIRPIDDEAITP